MDISTLTSIGLNKPQAKAYLALVQYGSLTPPKMAEHIKESRTNAYKILESLEKMDLAIKKDKNKKTVFYPSNPTHLETLAKKYRDEALDKERQIKSAMPKLLNFFYTYSEQPGVRFFQGEDEIKQIFDDMLRTRQDIYLIRSSADDKYYDEEFFKVFKKKRAKLGIKTYALTTKTTTSVKNSQFDKEELFYRSWLPTESYSGSAEWNVYGNKLAVISYGEEGMGMIIESPLIAGSFKQLFKIMSSSNAS